ncbi:MAG: sigma 54-interacting transcriptional regulator [Firmicutes bacterium]|jgi:transcriptional regulator with PAS, ATPase and Fis domain|nr:sigma 54-interacting transcriptional regulator [Bacillota bacterium]
MTVDKDFMEMMLECIPGLLCIDNDGKITYVNEKMLKYKNCTSEQMIGKHIKKFFPYTHMIENMENERDTIAFYQGNVTSKDDVEASVHYVLRKDGKRVGLMTYDIFQELKEFEQFVRMYGELDDKIKYYREELKEYRMTKYSIEDIVGQSEQIKKLKADIKNAAKTSSTVLITGETGTGKELVAHSIHDLSKRRSNKFVKLNITNLPPSLIESELFGYEAGSFTGAVKSGKKGRFEEADNGTLFIDEIETLPLEMQPKLLRVLQEREIERIGNNESIQINVRIISATNEKLEELVKERKFRKDLFYRLEVVRINVPSLRERKEDIRLLAEHFIREYNMTLGTNVTGITDAAVVKLESYDWPGNVRELKNVIERAMGAANNNLVDSDSIQIASIVDNSALGRGGTAAVPHSYFDFEGESPIEEAKRQAEIAVITEALARAEGNKKRAAEMLKIARPLLYQKMDRLKIE